MTLKRVMLSPCMQYNLKLKFIRAFSSSDLVDDNDINIFNQGFKWIKNDNK